MSHGVTSGGKAWTSTLAGECKLCSAGKPGAVLKRKHAAQHSTAVTLSDFSNLQVQAAACRQLPVAGSACFQTKAAGRLCEGVAQLTQAPNALCRNLASKDVGPSPLGSAPKADVRLHPNWTSTTAASASDAAIVITSTPIGRKVGWFRHQPPAFIRQPQQQQEQSALQARLQSAERLNALVSQQQLTLHIAGYPDDKQNGSMWQQCCSVLDWQLQGNLLWHDCYAR